MGRIRILFAGLPQMLLDLFAQALNRRADFERVGVVRDQVALVSRLREDRPDLLIRGGSGKEDELDALQREHPGLAVVSLSASGAGATLQVGGGRAEVLRGFSADELLDAGIRLCRSVSSPGEGAGGG